MAALSLRNSTTFLGRAAGPVLFAGVAVATGYGPLLGLAGALGTILVSGRRLRPVVEVDGIA